MLRQRERELREIIATSHADASLIKMVREADHSGGVTLSSIALLQERFRQLQKMKELRQERELKRTLSESARCNSTPSEVRRSASFSGVSPPRARPHCQLALSLWPESHKKQPESPRVAPAQSNLARSSYHSPPKFNLESSDSDIDTSLRL